MPFKDKRGNIDPVFQLQAKAFVGSLTTLLETMHHRTPEILNQYSLAPLQQPYVDVSAYFTVDKNPGNTVYHYHAIRVLAEQANLALGNGWLLPFHSTKNKNGIKFSEWDKPVLVFWGMRDQMMPAGQTHRFRNISLAVHRANPNSNFWVDSAVFEHAGHFAASDQPKLTADAILRFVSNVIGPQYLQHAYFGLYEIARQDEAHLLSAFKAIHAVEEKEKKKLIIDPREFVTMSRAQCEVCEGPGTRAFDREGTEHIVCGQRCAKQLWKSLKRLN